MASGESASGGWGRQVRRPFCLGTVGGLQDGALLDRFVCRRDEDSEAAFEELIHRHGAMVLRVGRGVLRDPQDAEDDTDQEISAILERQGSAYLGRVLGAGGQARSLNTLSTRRFARSRSVQRNVA
jgi:hypothetical protein